MNNTQQMGDLINTLPVDQNSQPTHSEIQIVNTLFKEQHTTVQKFFSSARETIIIFILYILFSFPMIDDILKKFINTEQTPYMLIVVKALIFTASYFILSNMYLVRT